jgi:3-isopropylmalate/(R)-2-methylmalate dehydratase large subunit
MRKRTLAEALIASHSQYAVDVGAICPVKVDFAFANDITAAPAINAFREMGADKVFDRNRCAILPDHFTPNKDIAAAEQAKVARLFAREQEMLYWEVGRVGVEHAFLPEKGYILPGELVFGADSHTCTGGALGAFSTGVGSTDLAAVWALGESWLLVPPTVRVLFSGRRSPWITGKDLVLALLGRLGTQGARYKAFQFEGEALADLPMDDRFTISNMAVEGGAKAGLFVPDEATLAYAKARATRPFNPLYPDDGASYDKTIEIDVTSLEPQVAFPHSPANVRPVSAASDVAVDQVFIGSCTNGRLRDMALAARILEGRQVKDGLRCIVIPASYEVWTESLKRGYLTTFAEAGAVVSAPTCGPCLGGHMGILAEGERCLATSNRNFVGRMGHPGSELYLAGPLVAAATAVTGVITDPREILSESELKEVEDDAF